MIVSRNDYESPKVDLSIASNFPDEWFITYGGSIFMPIAVGSDEFLDSLPHEGPLGRLRLDEFSTEEEQIALLKQLFRFRPSWVILEGELLLPSAYRNEHFSELKELMDSGHSIGFYYDLPQEELESKAQALSILFEEERDEIMEPQPYSVSSDNGGVRLFL
jgi:hypothetical protein